MLVTYKQIDHAKGGLTVLVITAYTTAYAPLWLLVVRYADDAAGAGGNAARLIDELHTVPEDGPVYYDAPEVQKDIQTMLEETQLKFEEMYSTECLKAIGITNQRETTVTWSKSTGHPLSNAIVWMDARTSPVCRRLQSELSGGRTHLVETCGLPISTYFAALKLLWLMENVDAFKDMQSRLVTPYSAQLTPG